MGKRLERSTSNVELGGVCAGLGNYLEIDPNIVRVFFIIFTVVGGTGVLIYLLLWLIMPKQGSDEEDIGSRAGHMRDELIDAVSRPKQRSIRIVGAVLVLAGAVFFVQALDLPWLRWFNRDIIFAILIIFAGGALMLRAIRKE